MDGDGMSGGWVRFENTMPDNLKIAPLSDRAFRVWAYAICYCSRARSDGFVPTLAARTLGGTARVFSELIAARLFYEVDGGYQVHDYLDHNPSRARIAELREAAKERTQKWRDATRDEDVTRHKDHNQRVTSHARDRSYTDPLVVQLCKRLASHIRRNDPKANPQPDSERWLTDMRLLLKDRNGDVAEVERIIDWCQADPFWRSNILSPAKLRKQFTQLLLRAAPSNVTRLHTSREIPAEVEARIARLQEKYEQEATESA